MYYLVSMSYSLYVSVQNKLYYRESCQQIYHVLKILCIDVYVISW